MKFKFFLLAFPLFFVHPSYGQTEDFEDETDNTTSFELTTTGATFTVTDNFQVQIGGAFGAGGSNGWLDSQAGNSVTGVIGQIQATGLTNSFVISQLAVWTSDSDAISEASGNVTFRGTPVGGGAPLVETVFVDPPDALTYDVITFSNALNGAALTALEVDLTGSGSGLNYIGIDNIVFSMLSLPVNLVAFEAKKNKTGAIDLHWKTSTERNNFGFQIQKSMDGIEWKTIAFVDGKGTSDQPNNYAYTDQQTISLRTYYYRLKQLDFDGNYEYSRIINIQIDEEVKVQIYPNPIGENLYISGIDRGEIILMNPAGQQLLKQSIGDVESTIPIPSELPTGVYNVIINTPNQSLTKKVIRH